MSSNKVVLFGSVVVTAMSAVLAFQPASFSRSHKATSSQLMVAVDPTVVTKKEYEDICGISFDSESLERRLQATSYLYPKHVEVIQDIAPIAAEMVDNVVSRSVVSLVLRLFFARLLQQVIAEKLAFSWRAMRLGLRKHVP
jgi:hypothetical protein